MKKALLVILSVLLLVGRVNAVTAEDTKIDLSHYKTSNFKEILKEEEIKEVFKEYSETDKQVTIYLFRGHGCGYCRNFLTFLNSITDEYGKYFKVVGFEVWQDQENSKLLDKISTFMGSAAGGVPYIIIGDRVFPGYSENYDEDIKKTLKEMYDSKEKHDVFDYNSAIDKAVRAAKGNTGTIIFWNFIFLAAATGIILYDNKKKYNNLLEKLETKAPKKVEAIKEEVKEVKKEVKKVSNAKKKKKK